MMKSVMNKLFEREYISKTTCSRVGLIKDGDNTAKLVDVLLADFDEIDYMTDEDNLRAVVDELRTSKERPSRNMLKCQGKIIPSDKKRKSTLIEETDGNESLYANYERKQKAAGPKSMGAENSTAVSKYSKLVKSDDTISTEDGSKVLGVGNGDIFVVADSSNTCDFATAQDPVQSPSQKNLPKLGETDGFTVAKKNHAAAKQPSVRNFTIAETCSFMSVASMKEWMNAKTSLSGSLKKKKSEK
ncbi:hypothetical protein Acr_00g0046360 [Actinidia rufa]|uniref:Uncharacterized protein n=1 Tax=Actinidia rufa TaxID=165716 RepID=A0A7J0DJI4_9ERIC|nr:hypothetical protein Acr_00g0046360 [Actinidia rufa]